MAQDGSWRVRANNFREVAEPFDIANFYLSNLNACSGPYLLHNNRPDVYVAFESSWCDYLKKRGELEASAALLDSEAPRALMYMSALPWAHEAKAFEHKTVGDWMPSGSALQEVPVNVMDGAKVEAARKPAAFLSRRQW